MRDDRALAFFRKNPVDFFELVLGVDAWAAQVAIALAVADSDEVSVRSCHGIGKTKIAAAVLLWFMICHHRPIVISTAPTDRQVKSGLWKEVRSMHRDARVALGGRMLTQYWEISPDSYAIGFTAPEKDPDKFIGFHAPNLLTIADEASGISQEIYDGGISGLLSSEGSKFFMIGNPTNPLGHFAKSFTMPHVAKFQIPAWKTPNFVSFGITRQDLLEDTWEKKITGPLPRPYLVTPHWAARCLRKWGTSSPLWISKVEANFPSFGEDSIFPLHLLERAREISLPTEGSKRLGGDVARSGSDSCALYLREGGQLRKVETYAGYRTTMATAGEWARLAREIAADEIHIDSIGVGAGVFDRMAELEEEGNLPCEIIEAVASGKPHDEDMFVNARAEWYWSLRTAMEQGQVDIDLHDDALFEQLAHIRRKPRSDGRIQIESKEEMKRRGLPSPDEADAAVMAWSNCPRRRFFTI